MQSVNCCCAKLNCDVGMNRACLTINNYDPCDILVHVRSSECLNCPFKHIVNIIGDYNSTVIVDTIYPLTIGYSYPGNESRLLCPFTMHFEEATTSVWDIHKSKDPNCSLPYVTAPGRNIYMPFVVLMVVLFVVTVIYFVTNLFIKKSKNKPRSDEETVEPRRNQLPEKAVDTFSGLCLLLFMFFNYNEVHYGFARHSLWNGIKFPDLIMPWFLWIFGFSISPNICKSLRQGTNRYMIFLNVFMTSAKIIILGLMLSSINHNSQYECLPFTGSLQQIGIIYFLIATMETLFSVQQIREPNLDCMVPELATSPFQWLVYLSILAGYLTIYCSANAPGCPIMYFGAGGEEHYMKYYNCTGGISGYLDKIVFGGHISVNSELLQTYSGLPFNKYGILPCISGSLAMFIGFNAGKTYYLNQNRMVITLKMILGTIIGIFVCGILSGFSINFGIFPLNYNLMSLSLMLLASSFANIIHLALSWSVDWFKIWDGKPLYYLGRNVLLIYVLHMILNPCFPIYWLTKYDDVSHCHYVVMSVWAITLFTGFAAYLHEKQVFLTV